MRAAQWIWEASRDLPTGVARRVELETQAHLQDADLPDGADVREVLGDPGAMNRELRRLYLSAERLEGLRTPSPWLDYLPILLLLALLASNLWIYRMRLGEVWVEELAPLLLTLGLWGTVKLTLRPAQPEVRRLVALFAGSFVMLVMGWWDTAFSDFPQRSGVLVVGAVLAAGLVAYVTNELRKLRRTLRVEEKRA